ncbi:MAG: 30S ribosome-binding factor RbfA [Spirochaetales bacterium]|nr:30S ribosome-binding factor RbfA [Spirochaetales bacterium]MCF7938843.1 30S ribosome-binding factor RbfA [Spirochaetales bacterium]
MYRIARVEHLIQRRIGELIVLKRLKDPRIDTLLTVSRVKVSKDFTSAKVYISGPQQQSERLKGVKALNHAAGFIQHIIGKELQTRNTPRLKFLHDESIETGYNITKTLENLQD